MELKAANGIQRIGVAGRSPDQILEHPNVFGTCAPGRSCGTVPKAPVLGDILRSEQPESNRPSSAN